MGNLPRMLNFKRHLKIVKIHDLKISCQNKKKNFDFCNQFHWKFDIFPNLWKVFSIYHSATLTNGFGEKSF